MTTTTDPRELMHPTPNGGLAIRAGKQDEFDEIPCRHSSNKRKGHDTYYFAGGLKLRIAYGGEEFFAC